MTTSFVNILIGSAVFWTALFSLLYFTSDAQVIPLPSGKAVFIKDRSQSHCTINATTDRSASDLKTDFEVCLKEFEKYKGESQ